MSSLPSYTDFFQNMFEPHPNGSYALYGLNTFGCDSIIKFHDEIWKFCYFKIGTDIPVYINKTGDLLEIDLKKTPNVTRMQICS